MVLGANKTCDPGALSGFESLPIPSDLTVGMVPRDNVTEYAMSVCCGTNSVNLVDDCVLWCELPPNTKANANNASDAEAQFTSCVSNLRKSFGIIGTHTASAPSSLKAPSLLGVGVLTMVLGWLCVC